MFARVAISISTFAVAAGLQHSLGGEGVSSIHVTGDSVPLSEEGFQHVAELKSDKEMKAFTHRVLMSEARYAADQGRLNGFVPFYSGTQAHLTHKGAAHCDGGETIPERLCLELAQRLLPAGATQGRMTLQAGSYGSVPAGCSVQSGGDWAAHYNNNLDGHNNGGYSLVCSEPLKKTLADMKLELRRASWVADGIGRSAQLSEDGFQKVSQERSVGHMRAYVRRLLESAQLKITDDKALDTLVRVYSNDLATQRSFAGLTQELKLASWVAPLGDWQGLSGATAPISEDGYQLVARLRSNDEMKVFIQRVLASEARTVQDDAALSGIVPFYSGVSAVQSLRFLQAEIRNKEGSPWVGLDVGRTAPLSEEGYVAVAGRRSNVQMKEFVRRVASANYMAVDTGAMNGLVPYHSGKISIQTFGNLVHDLEQLKPQPLSDEGADAPEE